MTDPSGRVVSLDCQAMEPGGVRPGPHAVRIRARHFVVASGAIGSPALLLRSALPDPYARVGKRTFLHPTLISAALMPHAVDPYAGRAAVGLLRPLLARRPD